MTALTGRTVVLVLLARQVKIETSRIGQTHRIIPNVGVAVQSLWVLGMTAHWIGGHKPTHAGRIVPSSKVVEARFGVVFFAGESEDGAVAAGELFAVGEVVIAVTNGLVQPREKPRGAKVVFVDKVRSTVGILRKEMSIQVLGASGPAASGAAEAEDGEDIVRKVVQIIGGCAADALPDAATVSVVNYIRIR